jgi:hypothetical protein
MMLRSREVKLAPEEGSAVDLVSRPLSRGLPLLNSLEWRAS